MRVVVPSRSIGAATALLVLAACGGASSASDAPRVNRAQVERLVASRAKERVPRLNVGAAACPADVAARQGETFQCTVDVEGQPARFDVTIAEILGRQVQYELRPAQAIVDLTGVSDLVRSRLDEHWRSAAIDCGKSRVRLISVGGTIDCTVFDGTTTRYVQAVVDDRDGGLSLRER